MTWTSRVAPTASTTDVSREASEKVPSAKLTAWMLFRVSVPEKSWTCAP